MCLPAKDNSICARPKAECEIYQHARNWLPAIESEEGIFFEFEPSKVKEWSRKERARVCETTG